VAVLDPQFPHRSGATHKLMGDGDGARAAYVAAAAGTHNLRERDYLTLKAAALPEPG